MLNCETKDNIIFYVGYILIKIFKSKKYIELY